MKKYYLGTLVFLSVALINSINASEKEPKPYSNEEYKKLIRRLDSTFLPTFPYLEKKLAALETPEITPFDVAQIVNTTLVGTKIGAIISKNINPSPFLYYPTMCVFGIGFCASSFFQTDYARFKGAKIIFNKKNLDQEKNYDDNFRLLRMACSVLGKNHLISVLAQPHFIQHEKTQQKLAAGENLLFSKIE